MTNNFLIDNFKHLTSTPENVEQLKKLVLQMAVQGKLTAKWREHVKSQNLASPDDPNYSAQALLEKIKTKKEQLIKDGKIKRQKPLPPINDEEKPFELPENWEWARIGNYTYNYGQKKPDKTFTYIDVTSIDKSFGIITEPKTLTPQQAPSRARKIVKNGTVIYSTVRPYLLNIAIIEQDYEEPIVSTAFAVLNLVNGSNHFLYFVLKSKFFIEFVESQMKGMAYPAISDSNFQKGIIPVPPIEEQQAIVSQVEKIFTKIDQLHAFAQKRLNYREKSAKALFSKINHAENDTELQEIWQTLTAHFHTLTQSKESVKQLRQSILQMAVQGKLTAKWREENLDVEPASVLLEKIKTEKEQLIKEGKIKRQKPLQPVLDDEQPFDLPENWEWVRLIDYGLTNTGTTPSKNNPEYFGRDYPFVKPAEISLKGINYNTEDGLTEVGLKQGRLIHKNSVLMVCIGGSIGKSFYTNRDVSCNQQINTITPLVWLSSEFLHYFLQSIYFQNEVWSRASGGTTPIINKGKWERIPISLPPHEEQKAIVSKVKQLMSWCDKLEKKIEKRDAYQEKMMQAVVKNVLTAD
jgi:type I restriction enzyme, S subunit